MRDAGFRETYVQHLVTLDSMVVGINSAQYPVAPNKAAVEIEYLVKR